MSVTAAEMPVESTARDYFTLLKPGVMSLVVFTGVAGMWLAPGHMHPFLQLITVFAIALGSGGGAAINMWYDRDIDAQMKRTTKRPIPAGRIAADDALALGIMLSIASVALLGLAVNWVAAAWLGFAIFFYAVIYTMILKRSTPQNIVIGGAAGAFPAVIGWAAVSPDPALMPWLMFAIVFLWTPPHFWALALYRHDDYRTAGVPMLPVVAGNRSTRRHIFAYTLAMVAASLSPLLAGAGLIYGVGAAALGLKFTHGAWQVLTRDEPKRAMALFGYSILYLFILFGFLVADHLLAA
ncbi:MAG: protoheme IX farnesyltransferase [Azospirillum brasilense]|nr:MAG: protoheme IX farnesyltransferase [Azospirillum brasilense]